MESIEQPAHITHEAPLAWLVREKLHPGTTLVDRVRKLRYKRRRPAKVEPMLPVDGGAA
jgi:hypothetical protein